MSLIKLILYEIPGWIAASKYILENNIGNNFPTTGALIAVSGLLSYLALYGIEMKTREMGGKIKNSLRSKFDSQETLNKYLL
jgi:hypothetical protein